MNTINAKDRKCAMFLSMLYLGFLFTSYVLSYRFVNIFSILTVGSTFIIPFVYALSDIITEIYGYHEVRKVIWSSVFVLIIVSFSLSWLTMLPADNRFDTYTSSYHVVFGHMMRVCFSNMLGLLMGMFLNAYILVKLKTAMKGKHFFFRCLISSAIGELLFTAVVYTIVQFHISPWRDVLEMIIVSYSVKIIFTLLSSCITAYVIKPIVFKIEGGDTFVTTENYHPFKLYNKAEDSAGVA